MELTSPIIFFAVVVLIIVLFFRWLFADPKVNQVRMPDVSDNPIDIDFKWPPRITGIHVAYNIKDIPHTICTNPDREYPSFQTISAPTLCIAVRMPPDYLDKLTKLNYPQKVIAEFDAANPDPEHRRRTGESPRDVRRILVGNLLGPTGTRIPRKTMHDITLLLEDIKGKLAAIQKDIEKYEDTSPKGSFDI